MSVAILPKTLAAVALSMALVPGSVFAQSSGEFRGGGTIFNFSETCQTVGGWPSSPQTYSVTYRPRRIGENSRDFDVIHFLGVFHAFSLQREGASFSGEFTDVQHAFLGRVLRDVGPGEDDTAQIRITSRQPNRVNNRTTAPVRIRGQIRNLGHVEDCVVDFDVLVQQR